LERGEAGQPSAAARSQMQSYLSMVDRVDLALDQAGLFGSIDEADRAVMTHQEMFGHVTDAGSTPGVAANGEEQLMLRGGDTDLGCLLFAPVQEASPRIGQRPGATVM
jgi:hypothetical protein